MFAFRWEASGDGASWKEKRSKLPVAQIRGAVLQALATGDLLVISGDTGCGKTTQVRGHFEGDMYIEALHKP
jgi:HrpA-like RNA helicase